MTTMMLAATHTAPRMVPIPRVRRGRSSPLAGAVAVVFALVTGGCSSGIAPGTERFVFVRLVTGPGGADLNEEGRAEVFRGHMANMSRLAAEQKLVIAGPYRKPTDPAWRGVFVMNTRTTADAAALVATDPGVIAGVFEPELLAMASPEGIVDAWRLEREMQAEAEAARASGASPVTLRPYVMLTASDAPLAEGAIESAGLRESVVWWGRFAADPGGVYVLDSTSADEIRDRLAPLAAGALVVDGWFSTSSLERMRFAPPPSGR